MAACLYAIGGRDLPSSVEMYDPRTDTWSYVSALPTARSALGATSGPCEGNASAACPYAIGGYAGSAVLDSVEMYGPTGSGPTVARATHFVAHRHGHLSTPGGWCQTRAVRWASISTLASSGSSTT